MTSYHTEKEAREKKPKLSSTVEDLIEDSKLDLVLCGGMKVGLYPAEFVWLLKPKNEGEQIKRRTKDLQRLASATRLISDLAKQLTWDDENEAVLQRASDFLNHK